MSVGGHVGDKTCETEYRPHWDQNLCLSKVYPEYAVVFHCLLAVYPRPLALGSWEGMITRIALWKCAPGKALEKHFRSYVNTPLQWLSPERSEDNQVCCALPRSISK